MEVVEELVEEKPKVSIPFEGCGQQLMNLIHLWTTADNQKGLEILKAATHDINEEKYESVRLLHIFCAHGLRDYVKSALDMGADPSAIMTNSHTGFKFSPLMLAAMKGDVEIVKMLLIKGATYKEEALKNADGFKTPSLLEIAAHENNEDMVDYLLSVRGIDPEFTYNEPNEALLYAITHNNFAICKKLLLAGLVPSQELVARLLDNAEKALKPKMSIKELILILQREFQYSENILQKNLIHHLFTVRRQLRNKQSKEYDLATKALSDLIDNINNLEMQRRVIHDLFQATPKLNELTLELIKSLYKDRDACRYLQLLESETETLDLTQKSVQTKAFNRLKAMKLEPEPAVQLVNNPDWNGKSWQVLEPFQNIQLDEELFKSWVTHPDSLFRLLRRSEREFAINTAKKTFACGVTLLHLMCAYGHTACVDMLLKLGADPSLIMDTASRKNWYTPLMLAVEFRHLDIVKLLVANKALYNIDKLAGDEQAETPLTIAARNNDLPMVQYLLEQKLDSDPENGFIRYHNTAPTALHWAVKHRNLPMCMGLLFAGADPDFVTDLDHRKDKPLLSAHDFCDDEEITFSIPLWIFSELRQEPPVENIDPEYKLAKYAFLAKLKCDNKVEQDEAVSEFNKLLRPLEIEKQNQVLMAHFGSIKKKFNGYPLTKFDKELMRLILADIALCHTLGLVTTKTKNHLVVPLNLQQKEDAELFLDRLARRDLASALQRQQANAAEADTDSEDYISSYNN